MTIEELVKKWFSLSWAQRISSNIKLAEERQRDISQIEKKLNSIENTNLNGIKWIGPATITKLIENGIKTQEDIIEAGIDKIKEFITSPISLKAISNIINK